MLENFLMTAKNYDYTLMYKPGAQIPTADTLSRSPVSEPLKKEVINSVTTYPIKDNLMQQIRAATMSDVIMAALGEVIHRGWPNKNVMSRNCSYPSTVTEMN